MNIYVGTDIIEVKRIQDAVENTSGFKEIVYSKTEIENIDRIKNNIKYQRYAGRFAAKEAIYKGMSKILTLNNLSISFGDVEIINDINLKNRPVVHFLNKDINDLIEKLDIQIDISISHINENATAVAIVKQNKE